jgi:RNA polymerase sigma factor (sigma-70 family)
MNMKNRKKEMSKQEENEDVGKLIEKYRPRLKSFISKRVPNKEDAEDILQDVFYQLIKTVEDTLNPIEQVAAWLYRVARNTIINKGKKKKEEELPVSGYDEDGSILKEFSEVLFNDDNPTPETEYLRSLVWQELETALSKLPLEQREAFELTELDGLPVKEVAKIMNIPVNTLLSRKHYAVKHLRKQLEKLYNDILYS